MRVLVACEYSGRVRDAFLAAGHEAMSCDILDTDSPGPHYKGDVLDVISDKWDLMIAHPPCTHLAVSGARHFAAKRADGRQQAALEFVRALLDAPIPKIALENPIGVISTAIRKPDQIVHPWMFGDAASKSTCLWLKNLPKLVPTDIVSKGEFFEFTNRKTGKKGRYPMWMYEALNDKPNTAKIRSTTFKGMAEAMAAQWGNENV